MQARRSAKDHWYCIYLVSNLKTGEKYIGRHTVRAGKKPFEQNSYWGSGSTVKRWRAKGDQLVKGVVMDSSKKQLNQDERETVDFFRSTLGRRLKNKEQWERMKYAQDKSQWKFRGI